MLEPRDVCGTWGAAQVRHRTVFSAQHGRLEERLRAPCHQELKRPQTSRMIAQTETRHMLLFRFHKQGSTRREINLSVSTWSPSRFHREYSAGSAWTNSVHRLSSHRGYSLAERPSPAAHAWDPLAHARGTGTMARMGLSSLVSCRCPERAWEWGGAHGDGEKGRGGQGRGRLDNDIELK